MDETTWNEATDPEAMLAWLPSSGWASERKLRLFAVACCRRVWRLRQDNPLCGAVEAAERLADQEVEYVYLMFPPSTLGAGPAGAAARAVLELDAAKVAEATARHAASAVRSGPRARERQAQAALLRCLIGNPFRPPPGIPASVLRWEQGTVVKMAEGIYAERAFDRMPVLGDALEEAGLEDEEVLGHCRRPGPHARGCFVVDLVLARE